MSPEQIKLCREQLSKAQLAIRCANGEPAHSPTEDALLDAITGVCIVLATLVDVAVELTERGR